MNRTPGTTRIRTIRTPRRSRVAALTLAAATFLSLGAGAAAPAFAATSANCPKWCCGNC